MLANAGTLLLLRQEIKQLLRHCSPCRLPPILELISHQENFQKITFRQHSKIRLLFSEMCQAARQYQAFFPQRAHGHVYLHAALDHAAHAGWCTFSRPAGQLHLNHAYFTRVKYINNIFALLTLVCISFTIVPGFRAELFTREAGRCMEKGARRSDLPMTTKRI